MRCLVAAEEDVATVEELTENLLEHDEISDDRRHITIKLHHVVLPQLAAQGFIEYDDRSQTVRYRELPVLERELCRSADTTMRT
ncbi:hypothetical protein [Natrinema sp. HArc-T2]|uniref:DUF7344 domain-containing protein n=1 Tax=Natrinema sp. HArc-T2 TaxID=3242701 RepID=UPI00359E982D